MSWVKARRLFQFVYGSKVSPAWPPMGPLVSVDRVVVYLPHTCGSGLVPAERLELPNLLRVIEMLYQLSYTGFDLRRAWL